MSTCHVFLPGLASPLSEVLADGDCPALKALLQAAHRERFNSQEQPADDWADRLAAVFGCPQAPVARAGWRADFAASSDAELPCLRADPVHLRVDRDCARVFGPPMLSLQAGEAAALQQSLAEHLAEDGLQLHIAAPQRWYLRGEGLDSLHTTSLDAALGRSAVDLLPRGEFAAQWNRLHTELQMLLHQHPVNESREAAGLPVINSLWLWGEGDLPQLGEDVAVESNIAWLRGLGAQPLSWLEPQQQRTLVIADDSLLDALQHADAPLWRERLLALEHRHFTTLRDQWRAGMITTLHIDAGPVRFTAERRWWKRWRTPTPLSRQLKYRA